MKTFKKFVKEETLDEKRDTFATFSPMAGQGVEPWYHSNPKSGDFSDPNVIRALNSFVGTLTRATSRGTLIPEESINKLRSSLSKVGISFGEVPMLEGTKGSLEFPLTSYGGRFGKLPETPHDEFVNDDGISHMVEGGLTLIIGYEMLEDNSYKLNASIK